MITFISVGFVLFPSLNQALFFLTHKFPYFCSSYTLTLPPGRGKGVSGCVGAQLLATVNPPQQAMALPYLLSYKTADMLSFRR